MSNNKTAVEWIFHQLWEEPKDKFTWYAILEKAKEMHKQEVLNFNKLHYEHEIDALTNNTILLTAEEFYNKEYGGNK